MSASREHTELRALREDVEHIRVEIHRLSAAMKTRAAPSPVVVHPANATGFVMHGQADTVPPKAAGQAHPGASQRAAFGELSARIHSDLASQAITVPEILSLPAFETLPLSLKQDLVGSIVRKLNNGELDAATAWPRTP